MKKLILFLSIALCIFTNSAFAQSSTQAKSQTKTKALGGITPEHALEYMKTTENLIVIEVNTAYWKKKVGFVNAMWIPHDEMEKRFSEIPKGFPVLLHCGLGVVSVPAYKILLEKRPDIPELSYIDGAPLIEEYNEWYKKNK